MNENDVNLMKELIAKAIANTQRWKLLHPKKARDFIRHKILIDRVQTEFLSLLDKVDIEEAIQELTPKQKAEEKREQDKRHKEFLLKEKTEKELRETQQKQLEEETKRKELEIEEIRKKQREEQEAYDELKKRDAWTEAHSLR